MKEQVFSTEDKRIPTNPDHWSGPRCSKQGQQEPGREGMNS